MADDPVHAVAVLLGRAQEAHHAFETTELHGAFDDDWPRWYAAFAIDQGIGDLVGRVITIDALEELLRRTSVDLAQIESSPGESWAEFTARRIAADP